MIEAIPGIVKPPTKQFDIRVGIILREDRKDKVCIVPGLEGICLKVKAEKEVLEKNEKYIFKNEGGKLFWEREGLALTELGTEKILLETTSSKLAPKAGLSIENVVTGRGFHWQKEIAQVFPGSLEVHVDGEYLILINVVPFEEYITCVLSSEMGPQCPIEFMKAQAVAARSWARVFLGHKHPGEVFDVCNDDDCQRYQGSTFLEAGLVKAAQDCKGEFLVRRDGSVLPAYYSKCCGGHTEEPAHVLGFQVEGLKSVSDGITGEEYCSTKVIPEDVLPKYLGSVDKDGKYFRWEYDISHSELVNLLKAKTDHKDLYEVVDFSYGSKGVSGRVSSLVINYKTREGEEKRLELTSQYEIRRVLHPTFLYSSAFVCKKERGLEGEVVFKFKGSGWGHGVGLCQIGGVGMALKGKDYKSILSHYYPEARVEKKY